MLVERLKGGRFDSSMKTAVSKEHTEMNVGDLA